MFNKIKIRRETAVAQRLIYGHSMTAQASSPPHFIGIGAQHAGTSWLHECLKKHPQLWLPPEKELHYFDRSPNYASPSHLFPEQPLLRFLGNSEGNKLFKIRVKSVVKTNFNNPDVLNWYLKYFLLPANDQWYLSLFARARGKIAGECSPSYSMLELEDVQAIKRLLPDVNVIFILRNPIDRTWSQFRRGTRSGHINPNMSLAEFKDWNNLPSVALRSSYLRTLSIWSSVFSEKQIYIGFYDQVSSEPQKFLAEILDFLGVASDEGTVKSILKTERVNVGPGLEIPSDFRKHLELRYKDDIAQLIQRFGSQISHWLPAEAVVGREPN